MSYLPCIEIEPNQPAKSAVIWLHGLGASGDDFAPIVPHLQLPDSLATRFVFPHAPSRPVTINGGMVMPAWYDILSMDIDRKIDDAQIIESAQQVTALIEREIERGVPAEKIVLAGFSQGGAVAYHAALEFNQSLAGLMTLSTYFATHETVNVHPANAALSVFVSHGTQDPVVPEELGQKAVSHLKSKGYTPQYKTYPMQHEVNLEQIQDIGAWLAERLG